MTLADYLAKCGEPMGIGFLGQLELAIRARECLEHVPPHECASDNSDKGETIAVRKDYFDSILLQLDNLREEVKRLRPPIKDYKIDAGAWNAEREVSAPRKHWIDTVDYRKRDPWGSI